jgi:hypothetical protein
MYRVGFVAMATLCSILNEPEPEIGPQKEKRIAPCVSVLTQ